MSVLHFPSNVTDGMDGNKQEPLQWSQRWQLLLPFKADIPKLVKEAALQ